MSYTSTNSPNERIANLTESERYCLLSVERRRLVLGALEGQTTPVDLADLASKIAEREAGLDTADTETVEHVKLTLHHIHLPKMDDFGVLTYDRDNRRVMARKKLAERDVMSLVALDIETDALFTILSHSRRRAVLGCLHEYNTPIALGDVADEVAIWEYDARITDILAEEVKSIYLSLYHNHIPKMTEVRLVQYSQERDAVTLTAIGSELTSIARLPSVR
jgi:hypothetical protein